MTNKEFETKLRELMDNTDTPYAALIEASESLGFSRDSDYDGQVVLYTGFWENAEGELTEDRPEDDDESEDFE